MSTLDLYALQLFLDVVELGSVSKAASRHDLAQPSVTARIQKLERQLHLQLLERTPTGSGPTAAGRQLMVPASEALTSAAALEAMATALAQPENRYLSIAATTVVLRHHLPGWLVNASLNAVTLQTIELPTARGAAAVRAGDVALAFVDGPAAPLGLRSRVLIVNELVPVAAQSHPILEQHRRGTNPNVLIKGPLIGQHRESGTRHCIEAALSPFGFTGFSRETRSADEAKLAAINGEGIAILPAPFVESDIASGRLKRLPLHDFTISQPIRAVWRGTSPAEPTAKQLLDAVAPR